MPTMGMYMKPSVHLVPKPVYFTSFHLYTTLEASFLRYPSHTKKFEAFVYRFPGLAPEFDAASLFFALFQLILLPVYQHL